jgi:two-component system, LytTR family, sensor kinase
MKKLTGKQRWLAARILRHALYWLLNVLLLTIHFSSFSDFGDFIPMLITDLVYLPGGMLFAYASVYYLLPRYFFRGQIARYIILQLALLLLYPVVSGLISIHIVSPLIFHKTPDLKLGDYVSMIFILVIGIVPLAWVRITKHMISEQNMKRDLEREKIEAELRLRESELKLLKAQIHPHFLFNTLNNLYALANERSEKTPEVIIRISDLLSYIIYDCAAERVSLEKEVNFITSYTDLEKLRYDDSLTFGFSISGDLSGRQIAPMILFAFVENCFKHGASRDTGRPWISLSLKVEEGWLKFSAANSKIPDHVTASPGIGIENARKRLELLYPQRHRLIINDESVQYSVSIEILFENG